jgi:hypothetical protein
MTRFLALTLALASPAWGQDVLATYHTDNCCLPPEYAMEVNVTIRQDGALTLVRCDSYTNEGEGCQTRHARLTEGAVQAIRAAALASGLAKDPATPAPDDQIPIGGGSTSGLVVLDGVDIPLLAFPVAEDAERVGAVLTAIRTAIPARLNRYLEE